MTLPQEVERNPERPLRLWPGVVAVTLQWLGWFVVPAVFPDAMIFGMFGGLAAALVVLVWWAFFSRIPRLERWGVFLLIPIAVAATPRILHPSIVGGAMGMMFWIYVIPSM